MCSYRSCHHVIKVLLGSLKEKRMKCSNVNCEGPYPLTFYKDKSRKRGFSAYCKGCHANRDKKRGSRDHTPARTKARIVRKHRRRARLKGLPYNWTAKDWEKCIRAFEECCAYCGKKEKLHADHFFPVGVKGSKGTVTNNMVPACRMCNNSKGSKNPFSWCAQSEDRINRVPKIVNYFLSI